MHSIQCSSVFTCKLLYPKVCDRSLKVLKRHCSLSRWWLIRNKLQLSIDAHIKHNNCGNITIRTNTVLLNLFCFCERTLRNKTTSRLLICLSISLLCLYIVFATGVRRAHVANSIICNLVAALLHYFTLTSVAWMSVESYAVYLWVVRGRRSQGFKFFVKCCSVAWGKSSIILEHKVLFYS